MKKTLFVYGSRSKMGSSVLEKIPENLSLVSKDEYLNNGSDYLFLCSGKEESLIFYVEHGSNAKRVFDFSGTFRSICLLDNIKQMGYALFGNTKRVLSFPGCSSWGIISALDPIRNYIFHNVFADVKFSKSAMKRHNPLVSNDDFLMKTVHPLVHPHQSEASYFLGCSIYMVPTVTNVSRGLSINLFFVDDMENDYESIFLQNNRRSYVKLSNSADACLKDVVGTDDILVRFFRDKSVVSINIMMDNLVNSRYKEWIS